MAVAILSVCSAPIPADAREAARGKQDNFVTRSGSTLMLDGKPFRFGGANVDWLALDSNSYFQPDVSYPAPEEVDSALATVVEMGGTVVRSHTLGINVGCPQCLQPSKGVVNEAAFRSMDYALKSAAEHGVKLIIPLVDAVGFDCNRKPNGMFPDSFYYGNFCEFLSWTGETDRSKFLTSPAAMKEFQSYVSLILNRVNSYTGVAYKDDPTILAWDTCNSCAILGKPEDAVKWVADVASHIKSIDKKHLVIDGSSAFRAMAPGTYRPSPNVDAICSQYYPHWSKLMMGDMPNDMGMGPSAIARHADAAAAVDRPFIACEFGWDTSNYLTREDLDAFLDAARQNPNVAGALYWNLETHAADHGWMPVHGPASPGSHNADEDRSPGGDWWAFYYTGRNTRWNTAADMYARGQSLRNFAYRISSRAAPALTPPPAPTITSTTHGLVRWRGSVGAKTYSVETAPSESGPWLAACDRCANDDSGQWQDPRGTATPSWYRVVGYSPDGARGTPSVPVGSVAAD